MCVHCVRALCTVCVTCECAGGWVCAQAHDEDLLRSGKHVVCVGSRLDVLEMRAMQACMRACVV